MKQLETPVTIYTEITVSCDPGYTLYGGHVITCSLQQQDRDFSFSEEPVCCEDGLVCLGQYTIGDHCFKHTFHLLCDYLLFNIL